VSAVAAVHSFVISLQGTSAVNTSENSTCKTIKMFNQSVILCTYMHLFNNFVLEHALSIVSSLVWFTNAVDCLSLERLISDVTYYMSSGTL